MSFTPAKPITSPQDGIHPNLQKTVSKHLSSQSQKPIAEHNQLAFDTAYAHWENIGKPLLIFDSACGTGESSRHLAAQHPNHLVIGLDQSIKRLQNSQNNTLPENCLLLRAECTDFWRLADQAQWQCELHTLLYPNPYPKPQHLQRRWHGEAAFINLLKISKRIELRTNWKIYAQEFHQALVIANKEKTLEKNILIEQYQPETTITAFERKYCLSGHDLWRVLK